MFRRRIAIVRRPRLFGPLVAGGLGYALGRSRRRPVVPPTAVVVPEPPDVATKLKELAALHESGALSDEEFALAKRKLIES